MLNRVTIYKIMLILSLVVYNQWLLAQKSSDVFVDKQGVMRWGNTKEEVHGFGVNYTVPFAYAYRAANQLGVKHEEAIDNDIYHFARLGFDLYRVHVWDCEISDTIGNLLDNDHLRLLDYTLNKMKERGIRFILTPIAYWGNGYPEPEEKTPGFSTKFGKAACLTNPEAIKAQETYLYQFMNHINRYTGVAYKDEPALIAIEICNEPHHGGTEKEVTAFINRMASSIRRTGCKKPVFYNMSHSIQLAQGYFDANIQGGTFQWYPTNLLAGHELGGNLLPNVDTYPIPFAGNPKFKQMAKIVYEFDAADVGRSYIYPAMARSFREAGMQVAAHFAYDPTYMAFANTEYTTHFMNLAYAPQKALSLMIASQVFHSIPMKQPQGSYPDNTSFGNFRVSYEDDLAEMVSDSVFIYTNRTNSQPPALEQLVKIAGFGNSPIVHYEGKGAYFLDRLETGVWRLEVMPDALWVRDPFEKASLKKEVAAINWRSWPISIRLQDLGDNYSVSGLNNGNNLKAKATQQSFTISPGTYLLTRQGLSTTWKGEDHWKNMALKEFTAPATNLKQTYLLHEPVTEIMAADSLTITATIASIKEPEKVEINLAGVYRPEPISMKKTHGYTYQATIPGNLIKPGYLRYFIAVKENGAFHTYPSGTSGHPYDWDFYDQHPYQVPVLIEPLPLYLFNANTDAKDLVMPWNRNTYLQPENEPGTSEYRIQTEKLENTDPENNQGEQSADYSLRYFFRKKIAGMEKVFASGKQLILRGRSLNGKACLVQVALVLNDGAAYGAVISLEQEAKDYSLALGDMKPVKSVLLPRPYPTFLPYYIDYQATAPINLSQAECIQISIGPGMLEEDLKNPHGIAVESVRIE